VGIGRLVDVSILVCLISSDRGATVVDIRSVPVTAVVTVATSTTITTKTTKTTMATMVDTPKVVQGRVGPEGNDVGGIVDNVAREGRLVDVVQGGRPLPRACQPLWLSRTHNWRLGSNFGGSNFVFDVLWL
jgi:hypothetical protein